MKFTKRFLFYTLFAVAPTMVLGAPSFVYNNSTDPYITGIDNISILGSLYDVSFVSSGTFSSVENSSFILDASHAASATDSIFNFLTSETSLGNYSVNIGGDGYSTFSWYFVVATAYSNGQIDSDFAYQYNPKYCVSCVPVENTSNSSYFYGTTNPISYNFSGNGTYFTSFIPVGNAAPEPGSLALLGAAGIGLALFRRRRRQIQAGS